MHAHKTHVHEIYVREICALSRGWDGYQGEMRRLSMGGATYNRTLLSRATSCPLPHSLPTAIHLASGASGIELAHCHTPCPLSHPLPTVTPLAHCHTACPLPYSSPAMNSSPAIYSLPTATQLTNGLQIANYNGLPAATELANGT